MADIENNDEREARLQRQCERVEDRIDIAACAYQWAAGISAYPWTHGLTPEKRREIRERVRQLGKVANGHGLLGLCNASDEAALAVFHVLPLNQ